MSENAAPSLAPPLDSENLADLCGQIPQPVGVTGATGFVGSHLLEALVAGGAAVRLLVRDPKKLPSALVSQVDVVVGDLGDEAALQSFAASLGTVLHLAGLVRARREGQFLAANAVGTANLVAALEKNTPKPRAVYVSSLAAAGPSPSPEGRAPEDPPAPISAYGRSKLAGEKAVVGYGGSWVILRPPAIYGPRDRDVLQFFKMASQGWLFYPRGERYVTVAFVGDVVLAVLRAAASSRSGSIFHLGDPTPYSMRVLLQTLAEAGQVRARVVPLPGSFFRVAGLVGDGLHFLGFHDVPMTSDKARELLARHWAAQTRSSLLALQLPEPVPFRQGAELTWAWYRKEG
ncbi:MAG: NAD-dependent epimerase/dehydratase family protein, partial [Thermoanaerobaculum sp.]